MTGNAVAPAPVAPRGVRRRPCPIAMATRLVVVAGFLASTAGGLVAGAASPAPPQPPVFGVQAGNYGKTTLRGGHFAYDVRPGGSVSDSIVITNYSGHAITVQAYGADLLTASGGGVSPAQGDATMKGVGAWVTMSRRQLDIPPGGHDEDGFTLTVPPGTLPGQYPGAIVVSYSGDQPAASGESIITRAALIIEVTLPGSTHLQPVLGPLQTSRVNGNVKFTFDVANAGNVLFTVDTDVVIRDSGGRRVATVPVIPSGIYVIPGGHTTIAGTWTTPPSQEIVTAEPHAQVTLSNASTSTVTGGRVTLCFFPWRLWIPLAVVVLLLLLGVYVTRGRWRARLEQRRIAKRFVTGFIESRGIKP